MDKPFDLDELLEQFKSPRLPSSSRVDSNIPQLVKEPVGFLNAWQYLGFIASQGTLLPACASWSLDLI
jgi:hypothetical protein